MKLKQTQFLKGSREFEIVDDTLFVSIKSFFTQEKLTVDLSTLDPRPVIKGSEMKFYSPHRGHSIFSLLLNKPNKEEFNRFIDTLKQTISGDDTAAADIETEISESVREEALNRNVYEEPPEFGEAGDEQDKVNFKPVIVARLEDDINMLKTYLDENDIKPLLNSLETLLAEPDNEAAFVKMLDVFNELGFHQGPVLTYAPYVKVLVAESDLINKNWWK